MPISKIAVAKGIAWSARRNREGSFESALYRSAHLAAAARQGPPNEAPGKLRMTRLVCGNALERIPGLGVLHNGQLLSGDDR